MKIQSVSTVLLSATLLASGAAIAGAVPSGPRYSAKATDLLPGLSDAQAKSDRLDEVMPLVSDTDINLKSVRFLGDSSHGPHWAATDGAGNICVITQIEPWARGDGVQGIACTPPVDFYQNGAALRLQDGVSHGAVTYLLPPDVDRAAVPMAVNRLGADGMNNSVTVLDNTPSIAIVTDIELADSSEAVELKRLGGRPMMLRPLTQSDGRD